MAKDQASIDRFTNHSIYRQHVRSVVEAAGFTVERVVTPENRKPDPKSWGYVLSLSDDLKTLFGRKREILLWASEYTSFQARTLTQAQNEIRNTRPRLSEDFALVFSGADTAEQDVAGSAEKLETMFVGFSLGSLGRFVPFGPESFRSALQRRLYSRDPYLVTGPITAPEHFFGRQQLISEIETQLREGNHVGVFGLRKMGKTSLLYRILEKLRSRQWLCTAHLDLQRLSAVHQTSQYLLWSLGEAIFRDNKQLRQEKKLRMFGQFQMFADVPLAQRDNMAEFFHHDIQVLLEQRERRLVFLFDEIELMWPSKSRGGDAQGWGQAFANVWRLLRGLDQENQKRLSYFVTGTSPECLEATSVLGIENPVHRYLQTRFLPHLDDQARRDLLTRLGGPSGLNWEKSAVERVISEVGGHPSLLRVVGSAVHRSLIGRTQATSVTAGHIEKLLTSVSAELNASLRQIVEALNESYPDDFMLLEKLAAGQVGEYQALAQIAPDAIVHLDGYQLVDTSVEPNRIRFEALQSWMQARAESAKHPRTPSVLEPGTDFQGYKILEQVSSGGFGMVYRAEGKNGDQVALKIFFSASFDQLLREAETLIALRHSGIVRYKECDRAPDGTVFLVTEFLQGDTLEKNCTRSRRLSSEEAAKILQALLEALASFHPDADKVTELRQKDELTDQELEDLRAASSGYVHRDIKPSNIVLVKGRGPVLIDFGISSKVSQPVKTVSATLGYLPPDFGHIEWTPDVDLYQLGITIIQALLGVRLDLAGGASVDDLRSLLQSEGTIPSHLRKTLLALTALERENRPASARQVLRQLKAFELPRDSSA